MANSSDPGGQRNTAFILGGVVVAVLVLGYFVYGGSTPEPTAGDDAGNTTVTIDNAAPEPAAPAEPAPAEPAAPAPAEPSAPAAGGTTQSN